MLNHDDVLAAAIAAGFDACGTSRADALPDDTYPLREWLSSGRQAGLSYMERNVEKRLDPRLLVPGAQTVISVVSAYGPPDPSRADGVAAYAQRREYHEEIRHMLTHMRQVLGIDGKLCCDTVPISDKYWAARAGLGRIGRHTLLITPRWGTWVNLGEIVTTEPCDVYDSDTVATQPTCGACHRCIDACPNQALSPEGVPMVDASRCTAYYNTHRSRPMPPDIDPRGYTQGCDICQLACPHNNPDRYIKFSNPMP